MVVTGRVQDLILNPDETGKISQVIAEGEFYGMQTFDQSLLGHVQSGVVDEKTAMEYATSPHDFKLMIASAGRSASDMSQIGGGQAPAQAVDDADEYAEIRGAAAGAPSRPPASRPHRLSVGHRRRRTVDRVASLTTAPPSMRTAVPRGHRRAPEKADPWAYRPYPSYTSLGKALRYLFWSEVHRFRQGCRPACTALQSMSDSNCPVCACAEIISGKWTLLLIRDLATGSQRFCELERSLEGISPRTLSLRLRALEEQGVVERHTYPEVPPRVEYALTDKGRDSGAADRGHAHLRQALALRGQRCGARPRRSRRLGLSPTGAPAAAPAAGA